MADPSTCPPLTPSSIRTAYSKIRPYVHTTPLLTSHSLDAIASAVDPRVFLSDDPPTSFGCSEKTGMSNNDNDNDNLHTGPNFRLFFKCENFQKIGAFKARGAFHAVVRLIEELGVEEVRRRGVVTHSSGNHAQALALAASTFSIPSYIVMPKISTPSKIAGTRLYTPNVIFSGSTSDEREAVVAEVIAEKNAILVPPYDHPDIIIGQGTVGLEMEEQLLQKRLSDIEQSASFRDSAFDAVITPLGGGGLLGGTATWFSDKPETRVFGAEPSFEGGDDGRRGLQAGKRVEHVKTLTIADGLRTPVGVLNFEILSDPTKLEALYAVTEDQIKAAMRLVYERLKVVVEPSAAVGLAVVLFNGGFRARVAEAQRTQNNEDAVWNVGIVFSGGNTTMKAVSKLFAEDLDLRLEGEGQEGGHGEDRNQKTSQSHVHDIVGERHQGTIGADGGKKVEDIAG
ncbi:threonine dehydratase [Capronia coronata CBS 617.96]|uniref:Threonine dehydratase n=1 Tax=Capronia coronata CBS 617.96 TaxID=1182541 RepID=W9Z1I7_9EURO|nr:threonine dehydratase [Capronia coronata CBS 617.96]EXJ95825.1 threonine dehydratase [Capronia coronata CBS 617.96]